MSEGVFTDGKKRWICDGASFDNGSIVGDMLREKPSSSSYQSRPTRQQNRKSNVVSIKQGTQVIRRARVTKIEYSGMIFCPTVSTGAFVARRNGQVFITGNSGFPKSLNVGKSVDKLQGNEREDCGMREHPTLKDKSKIEESAGASHGDNTWNREWKLTKGDSEFEGWGTALKPAFEPITMARKPLSEKTVAGNVLKWGTGCINIEGCRIVIEKEDDIYAKNPHTDGTIGANGIYGSGVATRYEIKQGRFPANLIHDGSEEVAGMFPDTNPSRKGKPRKAGVSNGIPLLNSKEVQVNCEYDDSGSASRFFYCAKANKKDRNAGLDIKIEEIAEQDEDDSFYDEKVEIEKMNAGKIFVNNHPTVKPTDLMRYLCRLVTPIGGIVLDPYMGSGTTGKAAVLEGFKFVGIEKEESSFLIAEKRIQHEVEKWN